MSDCGVNAMIILLEFSENVLVPLNNITKIKDENGFMKFSAVVVVERTRLLEKKVCLSLASINESDKVTKIMLLKEFDLNEANSVIGTVCNRSEAVPRPSIARFSLRNTYKLNFRRVKTQGKGRYILTLLDCSGEELKRNPLEMCQQKQISTVCFVVE